MASHSVDGSCLPQAYSIFHDRMTLNKKGIHNDGVGVLKVPQSIFESDKRRRIVRRKLTIRWVIERSSHCMCSRFALFFFKSVC